MAKFTQNSHCKMIIFTMILPLQSCDKILCCLREHVHVCICSSIAVQCLFLNKLLLSCRTTGKVQHGKCEKQKCLPNRRVRLILLKIPPSTNEHKVKQICNSIICQMLNRKERCIGDQIL